MPSRLKRSRIARAETRIRQVETAGIKGGEAKASVINTSAEIPVTSPGSGRFITFEGVDGAGKSTHAQGLADRLRRTNIPVILTREPGGTANGEAIRDILVKGSPGRWDPLAEALLLYAARRDHVERVIRPALERGEWVVCDRFADSSHAYQGYAGGVAEAFLETLDAAVLAGLRPDLTLILDIPGAEGLTRIRNRNAASRFEARGEAFQERIRKAFRHIATREPDRCRLIDASPPPETVAAAIWMEVRPLLAEGTEADMPRGPT